MSEYTYADVIIDPHDERVKVGERYYFGDAPTPLIRGANDDSLSLQELERVDYKDEYPFVFFSEEYDREVYFSCLIKPKEPQAKYVPFDLSKKEVRDKLRGKWIVNKITKGEKMISNFWIVGIISPWVCADGNTGADLLAKFTFLDGTPCGQKISAEE